MREILFRGKTDEGKWVYGVPFNEDKGCYIIEDFFICDEYDEYAVNLMVDPESVSEFTGLADKNGKKIFEGDIVKIYLYEPKGLANYEIGCIKFDDIKARFVFCTEEGNYGIDNSNVFEVIGNIHDNPELLKGGECDG